MPRIIALLALVAAGIGLVALLAIKGPALFSGSDDDRTDEPSNPEVVETSAGPPRFETWPEPAAVLVLTGEQHGYLEPCGCSENQAGGMARRSDLMKQLRARGWAVTGLDLGGTVQRARKQTEYKFAAITDALRLLDYRGLGLGPEELRLTPAFLLSEHVPADDGSPGLSFLGTNETFFGVPDMEGGPKEVAIFELGGVKIGAAMILGESRQRELFPEGAAADVTFTPSAEALTELVEKLAREATQVNILLSYASLDESRELARQFPQFHVILSAGGPEDPHGEPEQVGETLLVTVGHKGKYAGVLGLYPDDTQQPVRYELVTLDRARFRHDPALDDVMREYQQTLKDNLSDVFENLTEGFPPTEGTYVGAAKCGECHKQAYAKWEETRHAKAYHSLTTGREGFEGTWVERTHDPECLSCHVTGWHPQEMFPFVSGFLPQEIASERNEPQRFELLQGQQCENCHGPGSVHVDIMQRWQQAPDSVTAAELTKSRELVKRAATEDLCIRCHDYENSPDFDFKEYWQKVQHSGLRF